MRSVSSPCPPTSDHLVWRSVPKKPAFHLHSTLARETLLRVCAAVFIWRKPENRGDPLAIYIGPDFRAKSSLVTIARRDFAVSFSSSEMGGEKGEKGERRRNFVNRRGSLRSR